MPDALSPDEFPDLSMLHTAASAAWPRVAILETDGHIAVTVEGTVRGGPSVSPIAYHALDALLAGLTATREGAHTVLIAEDRAVARLAAAQQYAGVWEKICRLADLTPLLVCHLNRGERASMPCELWLPGSPEVIEEFCKLFGRRLSQKGSIDQLKADLRADIAESTQSLRKRLPAALAAVLEARACARIDSATLGSGGDCRAVVQGAAFGTSIHSGYFDFSSNEAVTRAAAIPGVIARGVESPAINTGAHDVAMAVASATETLDELAASLVTSLVELAPAEPGESVDEQ